MICEHLPFFKKNFGDCIPLHIDHRYSEQMSQISDVVSYWGEPERAPHIREVRARFLYIWYVRHPRAASYTMYRTACNISRSKIRVTKNNSDHVSQTELRGRCQIITEIGSEADAMTRPSLETKKTAHKSAEQREKRRRKTNRSRFGIEININRARELPDDRLAIHV